MIGDFSRRHLAALLASQVVEVVGIFVDQPRLHRQQPAIEQLKPPETQDTISLSMVQQSKTVMELGWENDIPVLALRDAKAKTVFPIVASLKPDIASVACFSQKIPPNLLNLPQHGFLNVHPSLLPAFRGPEPLFWVFRHNHEGAGVTVHFMDEGWDSGDIVAQTAVSFSDGISYNEANMLCAEVGSQLLIKTVRQLQQGTLTPRPQGENGRYFPNPAHHDFIISTRWSAQHAFNFIHGTANWERPYRVEGLDEEIWIKTAVSYQPDAKITQPLIEQNDSLSIQFNPGILNVIRHR
ncbi:MAG: formyltransferase family protein [Chloroflexota bacterium]